MSSLVGGIEIIGQDIVCGFRKKNLLSVKEYIGVQNKIIDKVKVEKGKTYLFTFKNNLGENTIYNAPYIICSDIDISSTSSHNTLYGSTVSVNKGIQYSINTGFKFKVTYNYAYITSGNGNMSNKNLSNLCLKEVS